MNTKYSRENIKNFFNMEADIRNGKSVKPDWKVNVREKFWNLIKSEDKKTLLELGAGAGYDSLFFMQRGMDVTAIDLSTEMVKKCVEKNIEAYELDLYNLSSLNRKFDCVYSLNTFLYIQKNDLSGVFREINSVLSKNGLFYMGLYGGDDIEKELVFSDVSDVPLFLIFHSKDCLKSAFREYFEIVSFECIYLENKENFNNFYSFVLRKII